MEDDFTINKLIRFIFNETDLAETVQVVKEIESDPLTENAYREIGMILENLDNHGVEPSVKTERFILEHSSHFG